MQECQLGNEESQSLRRRTSMNEGYSLAISRSIWVLRHRGRDLQSKCQKEVYAREAELMIQHG